MRLLVLAALLASTEARAAVCLEIDPEHDQLEPADRDAAIIVAEQTARLAGVELGTECTEHWRLTHTRLGIGIHVVLWLGARGVAAMAPALEALPAAYGEIFDELRAPPAPPTPATPAVVSIDATPAAAPAPGASGAFYARLGYAANGQVFGSTVAVGYRRWISDLAFDVAALNLMTWKEDTVCCGPRNVSQLSSYVRLAVFKTFDRIYLGGGLGYGESTASRVVDNDFEVPARQTLTQHGLQIEAACGVEVLRHRAMRVFLELDAKLPTYRIEFEDYAAKGVEYLNDSRYSPTVGASLAFGF